MYTALSLLRRGGLGRRCAGGLLCEKGERRKSLGDSFVPERQKGQVKTDAAA